MADGEDDPGLAAGAEHPRGVRVRQRQRLLAKNLLSRSRTGDHLRRMQRMRRRQQDRADRVIGEDRIEIGGQVEIMPGAKFLCRCHVRLDGADDFQPWMVGCGFDQIAAPAAETGNGGADHRKTPGEAGGRRIASMTAALSRSGPSSAIAARKSSA